MPQIRLQKVYSVRNGCPFKFSISLTYLIGIITCVVADIILNKLIVGVGFMELFLQCYHGKTNRETKFDNSCLGVNQIGEVKFVLYLKQFQCENTIFIV